MVTVENNSPALPQTGWHLDTEWANALQIDVKTFRKNCREAGVDYGMFGKTMIVEAESFFACLKSVAHVQE